MFRQLFRKSVSNLRRPPCIHLSSFHTTRAAHIPIIPFPAFLLGALKTGKLVSIVSISSKTSLTLLPHTFRRGGRLDLIAKVLAGIPLAGFTLLIAVGLDQAPNTSRLRLMYLTEEEEADIMKLEVETLLNGQRNNLVDRENEFVLWLQNIVNNLSLVATDDIRDPVRKYNRPKEPELIQQTEDDYRPSIPQLDFQVDLIYDSYTLNALCAGSQVIVYNLLLELMDYDQDRMAVILSHEIAHALQRHFVEQHAFASLLIMLGDILRGVFWMFTEPLGPYVNQKINESISALVTLETQTTYNRRCEKEADLVGLRIMAKAGYDPRVAVDVWERMFEFENEIQSIANEGETDIETLEKKKKALVRQWTGKSNYLEEDVNAYFGSLLDSWFGSTHPPSPERIQYMKDNMPAAISLYEEALRINGPPHAFVLSEQEEQQQLSLKTFFQLCIQKLGIM